MKTLASHMAAAWVVAMAGAAEVFKESVQVCQDRGAVCLSPNDDVVGNGCWRVWRVPNGRWVLAGWRVSAYRRGALVSGDAVSPEAPRSEIHTFREAIQNGTLQLGLTFQKSLRAMFRTWGSIIIIEILGGP